MTLDQVAAGALVRARPWDVVGAALAAPMLVWGFLGWFGTVGDAGSGLPGFYSGAGAAGIGLVLAAGSLTLHQLLEGRAHTPASPPVAAFLAGAATVIVLGGMIAKPDSATIGAGAVAGLLTALSQAVVLVMGWLRGSDKSVRADHIRAVQAEQAAADRSALAAQQVAQRYPAAGFGPSGYGQQYPPNGGYQAGNGAPPSGGYPAGNGYPVNGGYPPNNAYPPQNYPPQPGYPNPAPGYPPGAGYPPAPGQQPGPYQSGPWPQAPR